MTARRTLIAVATALIVLSACGEDPLDEGEGTDTDTGSDDKGSLTISGQNFTETILMAHMYEQVLEKGGYDVEQELVDTRNVYFKQLEAGNVQVATEYLAGIGDYVNILENGEDAEPVTSASPDESLDAIEPLLEKHGISLLKPAEASNTNGFAVREDFAEENDLETLSDLGELGQPIKLAAAPDCVGRTDCEAGLKQTYDIDITEVVPLGFGGAPTTKALKSGEVELGQFGTTDGSLEDEGFVLLEDDEALQPAQNLTPAVNTEFLEANPDVAELLNALSATLSTEDLAELNVRVDRDREEAADVAEDYLSENGLI